MVSLVDSKCRFGDGYTHLALLWRRLSRIACRRFGVSGFGWRAWYCQRVWEGHEGRRSRSGGDEVLHLDGLGRRRGRVKHDGRVVKHGRDVQEHVLHGGLSACTRRSCPDGGFGWWWMGNRGKGKRASVAFKVITATQGGGATNPRYGPPHRQPCPPAPDHQHESSLLPIHSCSPWPPRPLARPPTTSCIPSLAPVGQSPLYEAGLGEDSHLSSTDYFWFASLLISALQHTPRRHTAISYPKWRTEYLPTSTKQCIESVVRLHSLATPFQPNPSKIFLSVSRGAICCAGLQ
jgi:hypothetical protein